MITAPDLDAESETPHGITSVLLVDDHPATRAGIRLRLEQVETIQVVAEASDGRVAFALAQELRPDVAVVDLRMPDVDGLELLRMLEQAQLPTRVILLSAFAEAHLVQEALDLGAYGYVGKDSQIGVVADAVQLVAGGTKYVDPTLIPGMLEPAGSRLTVREREVLQLAADGKQNKVIAIELGLGEETVKTHLGNIMRKLDASSRTEAVAAALRRFLID